MESTVSITTKDPGMEIDSQCMMVTYSCLTHLLWLHQEH